MSVVVIGLNHHTSQVDLRERFAFPEAVIPDALQQMRAAGLASEAVILSTCNRVELYVVTPQEEKESFNALKNFLKENRQFQGQLNDEVYTLGEPQSLEHLFKVASGLDSMLLGETEILGQLKKAYDIALQSKQTGGRLNKIFQKAFNVAKYIRTHTNIQRGSVSVGSAAVELAEKIFETLNHRNVMVIGAGDTSEKTARALLSRGAKSVIVSNRSYDRAEALAKELGGRAVHFDDWSSEFANVDIVISSTSAPHYVIDRKRLEPLMALRHNRPLLLIDIAVPRDIEPGLENIFDNLYSYNIDDLQAIAEEYMKQRRVEIARCEAIITEKARELLQSAPHGHAPGRHFSFGHESSS